MCSRALSSFVRGETSLCSHGSLIHSGCGYVSPSNVHVEYLNESGTPTGTFDDIRYVRVRIVNYSLPIAIPFINPTFNAPEFSSTLPRESLGVPHFGAAPAC